MGGNLERAMSPVAEIPGLEKQTRMTTAGMVGDTMALNAIFSAFQAYQSGKMKQLAYEHEAAMADINAKMIENAAQFSIAEKEKQLADTLAVQNVMSAAQGRKGGSIQNIALTSKANLGKDIAKIERKARAEKVSTMMEAAGLRAAGKAASATSLIGTGVDLSSDLMTASRYL